MSLESATNIRDLNSSNPTGGDPRSQLDDHIRLLKTVLKATPLVIDRAYSEYTTNADITGTIPFDDTIPQVSEGVQVLTASITPKSTTSRVRARFRTQAIPSSSGQNIIAALFVNGAANAVRTTYVTNAATGFAAEIVLEYEHVPGSTSAQTYSIRMGTQSGVAIRLNGSASSRLFGGTMAATLILEEIGV